MNLMMTYHSRVKKPPSRGANHRRLRVGGTRQVNITQETITMELIHTGKRLKELQIALNVSSAELSRKTGISPQQMIRHRDQANMKLHTIQVICKGLGIKPESFITNEYN